MDGDQLRIAFSSWLSENPKWGNSISFDSSERGSLRFLLNEILVVMNFDECTVSHTSELVFVQEWVEMLEAKLAECQIVTNEQVKDLMNEAMVLYEECEWNMSSDGPSDSDEQDVPASQPIVGLSQEYDHQHFLFRDAFAAKEFLSKFAGNIDVRPHPEQSLVRIYLSLSSLGFPISSCEKLGILPEERIIVKFIYRPSLLIATEAFGWVESLFNEVDIVCTTEAEVLNHGFSLYFPGVVRLFLNRMADKCQRERDSAMGVNDAEVELMSMGFNLKDARLALKKTKSNRELALEKLIKWGSSYDWVQIDNPNPFINLCLSLKKFIQNHASYCWNCYMRHPAASNTLHYCHKNSCVIEPAIPDNLVTSELHQNYHGVRIDLSFIVAAFSYSINPTLRIKVINESELKSLIDVLPTLKNLRDASTDAELMSRLHCFDPSSFYKILRRIILTSGLRVVKRKLSTQPTISSLFKLTQFSSIKIYEVENTASSEFEAAKLKFGSSLRVYARDINDWSRITRLGEYPKMKVGPIYSSMWGSEDIHMALNQIFQPNSVHSWSYSLFKGKSAVAIVEIVEKPEYIKGVFHDVTNAEHFVIRYFLFVPHNALKRPLSFPTMAEAGWRHPDSSEHMAPPFNPSGFAPPPANPPHDQFRPILSSPSIYFKPSVPFNRQYEQPPIQPEQVAANFRQLDAPFLPKPEQRRVNEAALPPELLDVHSSMKEKFSGSATNERVLYEYMELLSKPTPKMTPSLKSDYIWTVVVSLSDLDLPSIFIDSFRARIQGEPCIHFKLVFNSFFPMLPPFISVIRPILSSSVVTTDGFVFKPPAWSPSGTVREQLVKMVKHLAEAGSSVERDRDNA